MKARIRKQRRKGLGLNFIEISLSGALIPENRENRKDHGQQRQDTHQIFGDGIVQKRHGFIEKINDEKGQQHQTQNQGDMRQKRKKDAKRFFHGSSPWELVAGAMKMISLIFRPPGTAGTTTQFLVRRGKNTISN